MTKAQLLEENKILKQDLEGTRTTINELEEQVDRYHDELKTTQDDLEKLQHKHIALAIDYGKLTAQVKLSKAGLDPENA